MRFLISKIHQKKEVSDVMTIEECIDNVLERVNTKITILFTDLTNNKDRDEKIISFLAVLELVRKNIINADQKSRFSEIFIKKLNDKIV